MKHFLFVSFLMIVYMLVYAGSKHNGIDDKKRDQSNLLSSSATKKKPNTTLRNKTILLFTKNGKGYVHDNIPDAIACIKLLSETNHFKLVATEDPAIFNDADLNKFTLIIFASTNNDVFDTDNQKLAFRRYIEAGGGFVGIHSVTGTERNWKWFKMMLGETFLWHPKFQVFKIINLAPEHPSMKDIPMEWIKEDECYFGKELYPGINVLMVHDLSSLNSNEIDLIQKNAGSFANYYPAVWWQNFDGGHIWITTLGHDKKNYTDPLFLKHLLNGIDFIASNCKGLDYSKAYAVSIEDTLILKSSNFEIK